MRRLILTEHQTELAVTLSVDERDAIRRFHPGIQIEPTLGCQDRYDITADQRIGLVCLPTLTMELRPKIPMASVLFLISYGCEAISWSDQHPEFAKESDLVEALAIMLARAVQRGTRRGLLNGYQSKDEPSRVFRGRLLFDEHIRRRFRIIPPFEIRHDDFTSDIDENRILLSALTLMVGIPHWSDSTRRELFRAQRLFGAVKRLRYSPATVPVVLFTRLNRHYQPAIALAELILRSASLDLGTGGAKGCAFLIDMNSVFERFVRRALRAELDVDAARFPDRAPSTCLDEAGVVPLKPDLCLVEDQRILWVGDAKYKRLSAGAYQNADLYQILAYTVALGLPGGTLIYAADEGVDAAEHVVVKAGKRLRVVALDLPASRVRLRQQIAEVARHIQVACEQQKAVHRRSQNRRTLERRLV